MQVGDELYLEPYLISKGPNHTWIIWRDGAPSPYHVSTGTKGSCDCPDHTFRKRICKHIRLARLVQAAEAA